MKNAYINDIGFFLPNTPVNNDEIEEVMGMIGGKPSRSRRIILRNNGIKTRHYAIDRKTGEYTHNNASLTAEAVHDLMRKSGDNLSDLECLSCGTSTPDQVTPGHASMVLGAIDGPPCDVMSAIGVCSAGVASLKYAYMSVATGIVQKAISTGSEFLSSYMRAEKFEPEIQARISALEEKAVLGFEKDFLRWMLSDGAGAALITPNTNPNRISLRIDWIDHLAYSGELPVCMYSGAILREDGHLQGWREAENPVDIVRESYFAIKQDARLLDKHIVSVIVERGLMSVVEKYNLKPDDITWYLPHYSSKFFRDKIHDMMKSEGFYIPYERWFTNLEKKGNTGAASVYIIMEELFYSGKLKKGDRLLCMVPESGRFSVCYFHLTVV